MKFTLFTAALLVATIAQVYGFSGLDISAPLSEATAKCFKSNGYDFIVIRGWESGGRVDESVYQSVANAWAGGIEYVDVYFFPCYACGNPRGQVQSAVNAWRGRGLKFGMMWFDIESPPNWGSCGDNKNFLSELVAEAQAMGVHIGIYSSNYMWGKVMCGATGFESIPLWYANWDNAQSFADFRSFGGWSKPSIKQLSGDSNVCGFDVDKDWY